MIILIGVLRIRFERIIKDIICSISTKIITINLQGGIGNQLFEISTAYAISRDLNIDIQFKNNQFNGCRQGSHPSKYYNNLFQKLKFVNDLKIDSTVNEPSWTYSNVVNNMTLDSFKNNNVVSLEGYFQSELYFKKYSKEIKSLFTPNGGIISYLERNCDIFDRFPELKVNNDYTFIGIRRGDYVTFSDFHNPCGMTYYNEAMNRMPKEKYYILTDDYKWAKSKFIGDKYIFMEINDDLHQLLSIALFKNYIISNSSFYWWGSYLSIYENTRIIAPDKWIFGNNASKNQYWSIYTDSMEVIERPIETH